MYHLTGLPKSIKVGPYRYRVEIAETLRSMSDQAWGICDNIQHTITYQNEWPCIGKAIDTVIHEVLHAIYHVWDVPEQAEEEPIVSHFGTGIAGVLIDNPGLVSWLNAAAKKAREE